MITSRVTVEVVEGHIGVFVRNLDPYDAIRLLMTTALSLMDGSASVNFNDGTPLTEDEEEEILASLITESDGGKRNDN